jgi:hypothetical protein
MRKLEKIPRDITEKSTTERKRKSDFNGVPPYLFVCVVATERWKGERERERERERESESKSRG